LVPVKLDRADDATAPPPADAIVALRRAIGPDDETTKIKALRAKLTTLNKKGKLGADGYRVLNGVVDHIGPTASPATVIG